MRYHLTPIAVFQWLSPFWLFVTPWTVAYQASLSFTVSSSLLKLMSIELVMSSSHLILSCPFFFFRLAQHQGLSQWVGSLRQVAKVLELQHQLPMNIQGWFPLLLTGSISLLSKGLSRVFSNTTVRKHQFFGTQPSLWTNSHIVHDYWKNHSFDYTDLCQQGNVSAFKYAV